MPRVTVIMGLYNCALTLPDAFDSLLVQSFDDFQIIVCDDGSNDDTYTVANEYANKYKNILLLQNSKNMGLNYTLNRCLQYVDSEYCARMDGDDISLPSRLEKEVAFLDNHPEYAIVSCPMAYFDEKGIFRMGKGKGEVVKKDFIYGSPIPHAPCMIRTSAIKEVNGYSVDDRLLRVEDYDLWMRMYAHGYKAYILSEVLYKMRDDRLAKKRRTWFGRRNEMYAMNTGFKMLGLRWYYQIFALRPLLAHIAPNWLYNLYHKH